MHKSFLEIVKVCDDLAKNARIDFLELQKRELGENFFEEYENVRIVNSFLFNFSKLQDKMGAKLFKNFLYELQEINDFNISMIEILSILENLEILETTNWQKLREIRNILSHEYPFDVQERVENIALAMEGFILLEEILNNIKKKIDEIESKRN